MHKIMIIIAVMLFLAMGWVSLAQNEPAPEVLPEALPESLPAILSETSLEALPETALQEVLPAEMMKDPLPAIDTASVIPDVAKTPKPAKTEDHHTGGESHILSKEVLEAYLKRDLSAFLTERFGKDYSVEYDLLSHSPEALGVAGPDHFSPDHFAWVTVNNADNQAVTAGMVQMSASGEDAFKVTNFVSAEDIRGNPSALDMVLPAALIANVKARAAIVLGLRR